MVQKVKKERIQEDGRRVVKSNKSGRNSSSSQRSQGEARKGR